MGKGHLSLGKTILTVEPGRGGEGSFISRKTVEPGRVGEGHLTLGTMIVTVEPRRADRGHLSLGTIILWEAGGGHLSLGTIILFQVHRKRVRGGVMGVICL